MALPQFSYNATVSASTAKQDKVEIAIEGSLLHGDTDDVDAFLDFLAPPREGRRETGLALHGRFFNRPRRSDGRFHRQRIRATRLRAGGNDHMPPLAGGWLQVDNLGNETWSMYVRLSLNPTRFARHQALPSRVDLYELEPPFHRFAVNNFARDVEGNFGGDFTGPYGREFALRRRDNWIPDGRKWRRFVSETFWPYHLRNCLTRLPEALLGELQRVAAFDQTAQIGGQPRYNLRSVETYWEFLSSDPIGTVLSLESLLRRFSPPTLTTRDYPCDIAIEGYANSRCLRLQTRIGETLKIYAKTNRRIRFEVQHQLSGERVFRVPPGGHTFAAMEDALPLITHLAAVAAERVNELLRHLRLHASSLEGHHTVLEFLHNFQWAFEDPEVSLAVLQILVNTGSFVEGAGINLRRELRILRDRGVLLHIYGCHTVAPAYQEALRLLQQRGIGVVLGTRVRRRPSRQANQS